LLLLNHFSFPLRPRIYDLPDGGIRGVLLLLEGSTAHDKKIIPKPRKSRVTGQGKGQPKSGFGLPANMNIESMINNTPAVIRIHLEAVSISFCGCFRS